MITEKTIEELTGMLETALGHIEAGTKPDKQWIDDAGWKIYDVRTDLERNLFDIDCLVDKSELEEAQKRINYLENEL